MTKKGGGKDGPPPFAPVEIMVYLMLKAKNARREKELFHA
jgi:hypothetical protein